MTRTFADKIIDFNCELKYSGKLPDGFRVLNPYLDNPETIEVMQKFYQQYYNDLQTRKFIIGINPSRHGAGVTGVPLQIPKDWKAFVVSQLNRHILTKFHLYLCMI